MKIAILGGTGDIGEGLALRLAADTPHRIAIGSREAEKAENKAEEYTTELESRGLGATVEAVAGALDDGDVLVSPATGMKRDDEGFHYHKPGAGSVTAIVADAAPKGVDVVGAFHNLAAARLANLDADLGVDTLVVGDDEDAKRTVSDVAEGIEGLRALDAGGIANAPEIEGLTPLLINIAGNNDGLHDLGVRFT